MVTHDTCSGDSFVYMTTATGQWELVSFVVYPFAWTEIECSLEGACLFDWIIDDIRFVPLS
ncbi:hypothetical protein BT63DRAFT_272184 [Microthyrium microscopicum]|uniref:Uncharacterized protein n=1 Tax=Microthyrium microscopicum TaxID=703497 RepID=A0A6A6U8G3_9PEZI|nr:hypothetical protein BT63DRAFT_272184 [Microthyrium microscopicum]